MWQQLVVMGVAFLIAGATCLGGAIVHGMRDVEFSAKLAGAYAKAETASIKADIGKIRGSIGVAIDMVKDTNTRLTGLAADQGESAAKLQRELNIWEGEHRDLEDKVQKIGNDLYKHFSLQMKKAKGAKK